MSYRYYRFYGKTSTSLVFPIPQDNKVIEIKTFDKKYYDNDADEFIVGYADYEYPLDPDEAERYRLNAMYDYRFRFDFAKSEPQYATFKATADYLAWKRAGRYADIASCEVGNSTTPDKNDYLTGITLVSTEQRVF